MDDFEVDYTAPGEYEKFARALRKALGWALSVSLMPPQAVVTPLFFRHPSRARLTREVAVGQTRVDGGAPPTGLEGALCSAPSLTEPAHQFGEECRLWTVHGTGHGVGTAAPDVPRRVDVGVQEGSAPQAAEREHSNHSRAASSSGQSA